MKGQVSWSGERQTPFVEVANKGMDALRGLGSGGVASFNNGMFSLNVRRRLSNVINTPA